MYTYRCQLMYMIDIPRTVDVVPYSNYKYYKIVHISNVHSSIKVYIKIS